MLGTDGRIYRPRIVKSLGWGVDEQALRVLDFYRLEPARKDGVPVAIQTTLEMNFRLY